MIEKMESVDKAVSTEDLCPITNTSINLEVARLGAMFNTLVENKVEAMKADNKTTKLTTTSNSNNSTPAKLLEKRLQRLTSSSTVSSSHKENMYNYKFGQQNRHKKMRRNRGHHEHGRCRGKRHRSSHSRHRISSNSPESSRFRYERTTVHNNSTVCCEQHAFIDDDLNETFDFLTYQHQHHHHVQDHHAFCSICDPDSITCSCPDNHNGQMKIPFEDDYVSINIEDFENIDEDAIITHDALERARRKRRKRHKKRKRKLMLQQQEQQLAVLTASEKVKIIDPDDLPRRARWTIAATACLLLLMCLILVGVTLRMAPIIDDMVRKENEELLNSLYRESITNSTSP